MNKERYELYHNKERLEYYKAELKETNEKINKIIFEKPRNSLSYCLIGGVTALLAILTYYSGYNAGREDMEQKIRQEIKKTEIPNNEKTIIPSKKLEKILLEH